jgi:hypothetical protein
MSYEYRLLDKTEKCPKAVHASWRKYKHERFVFTPALLAAVTSHANLGIVIH